MHSRTRTARADRLNLPALVSIMLGVIVVTLDISLTSTAIPSIAASLAVPPAQLIWVINIYYLAVVAALLPLGALGEIHGHRRVFLGGLLVYFGAMFLWNALRSLQVI